MFYLFFLTLFALYHSQSICEKYSEALNLTNKALVSTVVNGVIKKVTAPKTPTLRYFNGMKPANSTNFLDPANADQLKALVDSLVSFFGDALGCSDGTITPYSGPPMSKVHQPMGIATFEFNFFNDQVIAVLKAAGVSDVDQVAVRIVLNGLKADIVAQGSICDRYSEVLKVSNKDLVSKVVLAVFQRVTAFGSPTRVYFNGDKPPGSLNFLDAKNKVALDGLVNGLVTWFGMALGCSDDTIAPYGGPPLNAVHKVMGINVDEFDFFNTKVLNVLRSSGVVTKDLIDVSMALNGTKKEIVTA